MLNNFSAESLTDNGVKIYSSCHFGGPPNDTLLYNNLLVHLPCLNDALIYMHKQTPFLLKLHLHCNICNHSLTI